MIALWWLLYVVLGLCALCAGVVLFALTPLGMIVRRELLDHLAESQAYMRTCAVIKQICSLED